MYNLEGGTSLEEAIPKEVAFEKTKRDFVQLTDKELEILLKELEEKHTRIQQDASLDEEVRLDQLHKIIEEKAAIYQELLDRGREGRGVEAQNVEPIKSISKEQEEINKLDRELEPERLRILSLPHSQRGKEMGKFIAKKIELIEAIRQKYNQEAVRRGKRKKAA